MIITSNHIKKTSKFFCSKSDHIFCYHDNSLNDVLNKQTINEFHYIRKKESSYQVLLEELLQLKHEKLNLTFGRNWYTDLSDENILIEIKNIKNLRESFGQILMYEKLKGKKMKKMIITYGNIKSKKEMEIYISLANDLDIDLAYVTIEDLLIKKHLKIIE